MVSIWRQWLNIQMFIPRKKFVKVDATGFMALTKFDPQNFLAKHLPNIPIWISFRAASKFYFLSALEAWNLIQNMHGFDNKPKSSFLAQNESINDVVCQSISNWCVVKGNESVFRWSFSFRFALEIPLQWDGCPQLLHAISLCVCAYAEYYVGGRIRYHYYHYFASSHGVLRDN